MAKKRLIGAVSRCEECQHCRFSPDLALRCAAGESGGAPCAKAVRAGEGWLMSTFRVVRIRAEESVEADIYRRAFFCAVEGYTLSSAMRRIGIAAGDDRGNMTVRAGFEDGQRTGVRE